MGDKNVEYEGYGLRFMFLVVMYEAKMHSGGRISALGCEVIIQSSMRIEQNK